MVDLNGDGKWIGLKGKLHPEDTIHSTKKRYDFLVESLFNLLLDVSERNLYAKEQATIICKLLDTGALYPEEWNRKNDEFLTKGGKGFLNFSGTRKVQVVQSSIKEINEKITEAEKKFYQCVDGWSEGAMAKNKIDDFVRGAFKRNQEGKFNLNELQRLIQKDYDDPLWDEAVMLLVRSIDDIGTSQNIYPCVRVSTSDSNSSWKQVVMNFTKFDIKDVVEKMLNKISEYNINFEDILDYEKYKKIRSEIETDKAPVEVEEVKKGSLTNRIWNLLPKLTRSKDLKKKV